MAFYTNFATEFFHTVSARRSDLKGTLRRDQKVIFVKSPVSSPIVMPYIKSRKTAAVQLHSFDCAPSFPISSPAAVPGEVVPSTKAQNEPSERQAILHQSTKLPTTFNTLTVFGDALQK